MLADMFGISGEVVDIPMEAAEPQITNQGSEVSGRESEMHSLQIATIISNRSWFYVTSGTPMTHARLSSYTQPRLAINSQVRYQKQ